MKTLLLMTTTLPANESLMALTAYSQTMVYFLVAALLAFFSLIMIFILYVRRIMINARDKKIQALQFSFQYLIYEALVESQATQGKAQQLIVEKLKKEACKSSLHQQTLADLIINLKRNFSGDAEKQFVQLYHLLHLSQYSLKKLRARRWDVRVKGIRELVEMKQDHLDTQLAITNLITDKNPVVAQEAQMASIVMENTPLDFLYHLQQPLTAWHELSLHHLLLKLDPKLVPVFTPWLSSSNESVVLFSLKMIAYFEQQQACGQVVQCLSHPAASVREEASCTLSRLTLRHTPEANPETA